MKKVYYKGQPYDYKVMGNIIGKRHFLLYADDVLMHFVEEGELDKKSIVSTIKEACYRQINHLMHLAHL